MAITIFIRMVGGLRVCWSGHVHETELMCARGGYIFQIINKSLDKDHMCASPCPAPTSLPHVPLRACAGAYQQECWDCLVSSGDIMAGCQTQQGGLSTSFLPVASARTMPRRGPTAPAPTVRIFQKSPTIGLTGTTVNSRGSGKWNKRFPLLALNASSFGYFAKVNDQKVNSLHRFRSLHLFKVVGGQPAEKSQRQGFAPG